ncbi:MAG: succinate dehydrogenase cytochrome b subunit [Cytophagales bacterium]|nr:succinate dehydrogenase cytochrome b subunit [Cytophagales bacterium]
MSTWKETLQGTLTKKLVVAFSGSFLLVFLVGHLLGNLALMGPLEDEVRWNFNAYAHFMTSNPFVKALSYLTYASFLVHILYAILLACLNRRARPIGYAKRRGKEESWASRNMGLLGTLIFIFLVIHLRSFWYEMHWGDIPLDAKGNKDLYEVVVKACSELWYVILYVLSMVFLGYHLYHGISSASRTFGWDSQKWYGRAAQIKGRVYAILIPFLFALIPVVIFLRTL